MVWLNFHRRLRNWVIKSFFKCFPKTQFSTSAVFSQPPASCKQPHSSGIKHLCICHYLLDPSVLHDIFIFFIIKNTIFLSVHSLHLGHCYWYDTALKAEENLCKLTAFWICLKKMHALDLVLFFYFFWLYITSLMAILKIKGWDFYLKLNAKIHYRVYQEAELWNIWLNKFYALLPHEVRNYFYKKNYRYNHLLNPLNELWNETKQRQNKEEAFILV